MNQILTTKSERYFWHYYGGTQYLKRSLCVSPDGMKLLPASFNEIIIWDFDDM